MKGYTKILKNGKIFWKVQLNIDGKTKYFGTFDNEKDAEDCAKNAREKHPLRQKLSKARLFKLRQLISAKTIPVSQE